MVVGQQTYGWGFIKPDAEYWGTSPWENNPKYLIKQLMGVYKDFHLGEKYFNTPFWRLSHKLYHSINPNGPDYGFLWSNLIRIDQDQNCPEPPIEELVCNSFPVLPLEINIIKANVVIFFTGPNYDLRLQKTFKRAEYQNISNYKIRKIARISHEDLPFHTYRTYHPNYLYRAGETHLLNVITNLVTGKK
ncbi:hypothetical protein ACFLYB_00395 [Chloroflexota bacterium]